MLPNPQVLRKPQLRQLNIFGQLQTSPANPTPEPAHLPERNQTVCLAGHTGNSNPGPPLRTAPNQPAELNLKDHRKEDVRKTGLSHRALLLSQDGEVAQEYRRFRQWTEWLRIYTSLPGLHFPAPCPDSPLPDIKSSFRH